MIFSPSYLIRPYMFLIKVSILVTSILFQVSVKWYLNWNFNMVFLTFLGVSKVIQPGGPQAQETLNSEQDVAGQVRVCGHPLQ